MPEAVVYPAEEGAVAAVLRIAADANLAVVPFGGGSSVVGGVEPRTAAGQAGALSLDTTRLDRLLRIDRREPHRHLPGRHRRPVARSGARRSTATRSATSRSRSSTRRSGGWIATRSVGQQSDGYGGIDELLVCAARRDAGRRHPHARRAARRERSRV